MDLIATDGQISGLSLEQCCTLIQIIRKSCDSADQENEGYCVCIGYEVKL